MQKSDRFIDYGQSSLETQNTTKYSPFPLKPLKVMLKLESLIILIFLCIKCPDLKTPSLSHFNPDLH